MDQYIVTGMSCAACQARVEKAVSKVAGVEEVSVSLLTNSMGVKGAAASEDIIKAVKDAGYGARIKGEHGDSDRSSGKANNSGAYSTDYDAEKEALRDTETPRLKKRLIFSVIFLIALMYITMGHNMWGWPVPAYFEHNHLGLAITQMLLACIVMLINKDFFTRGLGSVLHGATNMDTLVALGSGVSFGWSVFVVYQMCGMITDGASNMELMKLYHDQLYFESAAMIPALITVGKMLEAMSKGRTTNALKSLMDLSPKSALIEKDGEEVKISVDEVSPGDIFILKPGSIVPVDGIVLEGEGALNESALTGESIPVDKTEGDVVSAATINNSGYMKCRATRVGADTTLSQIIHMVSDAAATKAPIAKIADRVSGVFVPVVIVLALIVIAGWLVFGESVSFALARGISVLVISCPCALGLATPVAIMVGNGMGAKNGILFKTSEALENAGRIKVIALDKTGTITTGEPVVTDIYTVSADGSAVAPNRHDAKSLLEKAYLLEKKSEHPLAGAIVNEYEKTEKQCEDKEVMGFEVLPGNGLKGVVEGHELCAGSEKYIKSIAAVPDEALEISNKLSGEGKTPLFFAEDGKLIGIIAVSDAIKADSTEAIAGLKSMGLKVIMITGDNERTARAIGKAAGVDEVMAGVLPNGKEKIIRDLQSGDTKVAMVGDGINDAPALVRADTGIAIGAGTDVAIDSADIVLMNSSLMDVVAAIRLSRATLKNIHENLFWAFIYNAICIPLAAGLFSWELNPMIAAAAMSLSSFTVCMNALRLNLFRIS
ncbi:MAG: copper-translocating P-type ATPase [Eubacterium sp.]|nr:copper-translocating P-type ATPase [Eubacterium sp.]